MPLAPTTKLGPYEIIAPLGAGGMGEVVRARDTRLGREVALKILPESFARESDRLVRFEQEARAVAALNHPNILAVFDVGQHNGSPFLVSELLEGETLRAVLDRGALPQRKAIEYAVQIAQGLAAAHEKGIVHRDLKPENVFVTRGGRIKILDFGLAKLAQKPGAEAAADGITLTSSHTAAGVVMGTASYMAPEQVRGQAVDARTDIFSFGAILYEMLSGKRTFRRDTVPETMTAVLKEDPPDLADSTPGISPALDRIVRRCLEKNQEQRFQSAKDLSFALASLSGADSSAAAKVVAAGPGDRSAVWKAVAIALAVVAVCGAVAWFFAPRPAAKARMQFAIRLEAEVTQLAVSRDGSMLAFVSPDEGSGLPALYVERVGSPGATLLPGTDGASYPFWSPDGANIAFFADGKLERMPVAGGPTQKIADVRAARGGSWGSQNTIIYAPDAGSAIWRVNPDGTGAAPVTDASFNENLNETHRWPYFLPDGKHFLYWEGNFGNDKSDRYSGIYLSSLDRKEKRKQVVICHSNIGIASGRLFYADDDHRLVSVALDASTGNISGGPVPVANIVGFQPSTYWADFTISDTGTLIYSSNPGASLSELAWLDRTGKRLGVLGQPGVMCNPTISPDGGRVSVDITDDKASNVDIWLLSTRDAGTTRFTFEPEEEVAAVWSRDGRNIVFRSNLSAGAGLVLKPASGLGQSKTLVRYQGSDDIIPNSWSPDDRQILATHDTTSGTFLELVPASGGTGTRFHHGSGSESTGMISPDGKWVAYASDESGNWEIYVTTFPGADGKWQVSRGGGTQPRWRGDSKEIYYEGPSGILMAVPVNTQSGFATGTPAPLFQIHGRFQISSTDTFTYDASKDGTRFLVNRYVKPDHVAPLTIVLNAAAPEQQ